MIYSRYLTKESVASILNISVAEVEELILKERLEIIKFNDGDVRISIGSVLKCKKGQDQ